MSSGKGNNANTHNKIVAAFWDLYCDKDIRDITVSQITDRAGLHRVTFYRHFKNVEEVLREIEASLLVPEKIPHNLELHHESPIDVYGLMRIYEQYFIENLKYFSVLLGPMGDPYFAERCLDFLNSRLEKHGSFCFDDGNPLISQAILKSLFVGWTTLLNYWHQHPDQLDLEAIRQIMHEMHDHGLSHFWKSAKIGTI